MNAKRMTAFCLCAVMAFACVLSGCGKDSEGETLPSTTAAQLTTAETQGTTSTAATEAETQEATETQKESQPSYEPPKNFDSTVCHIMVNNKAHKVSVGSTVTYSFYLRTPDKIEDVQAKVNYTGEALKLVDTKKENLFPVLGKSAIENTDNPSIVKFNAVNLEGFDFTSGGELVTLKFKVISSISGGISGSVEYLTEVGGKSYVDNCKVDKGVNLTMEESLSY